MDAPAQEVVNPLGAYQEMLRQAYAMGGVPLLLAVGLMVCVRLYRKPFVQDVVLPFLGAEKIKWDNLSANGQRALVFLGGLITVSATALLGGMPWADALIAGIPVGAAAMIANWATKKMGEAAAPVAKRLPKSMRSVTDLIAPSAKRAKKK